MSIGKIELSVGAIKIGDKRDILTEEEIDTINNKIPELDERVGVIEIESENINNSLKNKLDKNANESVTWAMLDSTAKKNITGGNTPFVGDNSVNTAAIMKGAVTTEKLAFWVNEHVNFSVYNYPDIYTEGESLIIKLKANTRMYTKSRIGGDDIVYSFPSVDTTITLLHDEVLLWDLTQNTVIKQGVADARTENNILLAYNHYGNMNYGAITQFYPKKYDRRTRKGEIGYFDKTVNIDTSTYTLTIPAITSVWYAGEKYVFEKEQVIQINDEGNPNFNAFFICFDTRNKQIKSVHNGKSIDEDYVILGWVDKGVSQYACLNGNFTIDKAAPPESSKIFSTNQMGMISTLTPITIDTTNKEVIFPQGIGIWFANHRYRLLEEQKVKFDDYGVKAIYFNYEDKKFYSVLRDEKMNIPSTYVLLGWVDTGVPSKSYFNGDYIVDGYNTVNISEIKGYSSQTFISGVGAIDVRSDKIIFPKGLAIWCDNTRFDISSTDLEVAIDRSHGACFGVYFNRKTKTIQTVHYKLISEMDAKNEILIGYVDFGVPNIAYFNGDYIINGVKKSEKTEIRLTSEGRAKIIENFSADQGMTVVNEEIWVFRHSADDHTSYGKIEVYDKDTFAHKGVINHNLGHAGGTDYCKETDTLMQTASNITYNGVIIQPEIMLIPNISYKKVGNSIDYHSEAIPVKLHEVKDGVVTKHLGGTGIVWTFGESPYIAYGHSFIDDVTGNIMYDKCYFFKVLLGTGDIDFSDSTGEDNTRFGTFIPGKADNEYNGTAKLLGKFTSPYLGINQGICYHEGFLYLATTTSYNTAEVIKLSLMEDGTVKEDKRFRCPSLTRQGLAPGYEAEGVAILDGRYLIAGYRGNGIEQASLFPLYNQMGGKGTIGVKVNLPFKCNSLPQINITPTSSVTDLYISEVDCDSFMVTSASGKSGTFNWSCMIS